MNAFLFVFDSSRVSREQVWRKLDKIAEIENWYSLFANTFCIASEQNAKWLAARLRDDVIPDVRFLIVEIDPIKRGGWLPRELWEFLSEPTTVERDEEEQEKKLTRRYGEKAS